MGRDDLGVEALALDAHLLEHLADRVPSQRLQDGACCLREYHRVPASGAALGHDVDGSIAGQVGRDDLVGLEQEAQVPARLDGGRRTKQPGRDPLEQCELVEDGEFFTSVDLHRFGGAHDGVLEAARFVEEDRDDTRYFLNVQFVLGLTNQSLVGLLELLDALLLGLGGTAFGGLLFALKTDSLESAVAFHKGSVPNLCSVLSSYLFRSLHRGNWQEPSHGQARPKTDI